MMENHVADSGVTQSAPRSSTANRYSCFAPVVGSCIDCRNCGKSIGAHWHEYQLLPQSRMGIRWTPAGPPFCHDEDRLGHLYNLSQEDSLSFDERETAKRQFHDHAYLSWPSLARKREGIRAAYDQFSQKMGVM